MRTAFGVIVLLFSTSAGAVAQTIAGDWSGTLNAGAVQLRLALHVSVGESGSLKATLDSLDQGAIGIPVSTITLNGSAVSFQIDAIRSSYEGTLNADATVIIVMRETDDAARAAKLREALAGTVPEAAIDARVKTLLDPWFKQFLAYDPAPVLTKLTCPVLALSGQLDKQVSPDQNLPAIRAAFAASGNRNVDVEELPGLNHLFQTAKTGSPAEYAQIEETIALQALEKIVGWILKQPAR